MLVGASVRPFEPLPTEPASPLMRIFYRSSLPIPISLRFPKRGSMSISRFTALSVLLLCAALSVQVLSAQSQSVKAVPANSALAGSAPAAETAAPKLEHFDPNLIDKSLDPCNDFYKYACNKWITANPIPPDQVYWTTGSNLQLWNENLLRETLEAAS